MPAERRPAYRHAVFMDARLLCCYCPAGSSGKQGSDPKTLPVYTHAVGRLPPSALGKLAGDSNADDSDQRACMFFLVSLLGKAVVRSRAAVLFGQPWVELQSGLTDAMIVALGICGSFPHR